MKNPISKYCVTQFSKNPETLTIQNMQCRKYSGHVQNIISSMRNKLIITITDTETNHRVCVYLCVCFVCPLTLINEYITKCTQVIISGVFQSLTQWLLFPASPTSIADLDSLMSNVELVKEFAIPHHSEAATTLPPNAQPFPAR